MRNRLSSTTPRIIQQHTSTPTDVDDDYETNTALTNSCSITKISNIDNELMSSSKDTSMLQQQQYTKFYYHCPCGMPIHVMNSAITGEHYLPSTAEELANFLTHVFPAIFAVAALLYMINTVANTRRELVTAVIYGGCCILLFSVSSIYHLCGLILGKTSKMTIWFMTLDHSVIYAFIAASYTPWLVLIDVGIGNIFGKIFMFLIWGIGVFGVLKSVGKWFPDQNPLLLYLLMGWLSIVYMAIFGIGLYMNYVQTELNILSLVEVFVGGVLYSLGTIFWRRDGTIPFAHAVWHLFSVAACACHMHAVHVYLMALE